MAGIRGIFDQRDSIIPTVPRRGLGYTPTTATPSLNPAGAFTPPQRIDFGPAVQEISRQVQQHAEHADQVALLEADNQLASLSTNLEVHTLQRKGKDALSAGPEVQDAWTKGTSDIANLLTNDRQRKAFKARSDHHWEVLNETVQKHGAAEFQKYDAENTDIGIKKRVEQAVNHYTDPSIVGQSLAESKDLVAFYGERNGWSPEQIADKQLTATTQIHGSVISRMIADGADQTALAYFKKTKPEINADTATQLEQHLDVASTDGMALRAADVIWKSLGPKNLNDPVRMATMEQEARDKYSDNPKVLKAAIQELRSRAQAQNAEQTEVGASSKATILGAFAKGADVNSLIRTPQYLSLSGTEQEQLKSYMLRERREEANRPPDKKNWAAYWGYSEPSRLASMSDNQVLALAPEIGQGLVNQLMQQKRSTLKTEEQVRDATIDSDQFLTVAEEAGLKPYDKNADKATLGKLRSTVESEIDRQQQAKGKKLTRDEKASVMKSVIDQKVMLDTWGGNEEQTAALVTKDQRGIAYVPIERVPASYRKQAIDWMRQRGLALPSENETQVMNRYTKRIERAYGVRASGGTRQEIEDILAGNK